MQILLILAHPSKASFNHAIADRAKAKLMELGHQVVFHDLYAESFPPLLTTEEIPKEGKIDKDIRKHCDEISLADGLIIVHPNWWGMPPAILKGWIDRVLRPGIAYEFSETDLGDGIPKGLLKAKTAIIFNTSNTNRDREENIFLDPLETLWKNCILYLCGIKIFYRKMFRILVTSSAEEREGWLGEVDQIVAKHFG